MFSYPAEVSLSVINKKTAKTLPFLSVERKCHFAVFVDANKQNLAIDVCH